MSTARSISPLRFDGGNGRKRSFGRMFDKIKMALRKREAAGIDESTAHSLTQARVDNSAGYMPRTFANPLALLAVDDNEGTDSDADEAIIPLGLLGRKATGISEVKARQFFEQHGLTYHTRAPSGEPAAKLRRVERPARIRVRWTCHSCRSAFGMEKYCPGCGHRRCFECSRDPCSKVKVPELRANIEAASLAIRPSACTAAQARPANLDGNNTTPAAPQRTQAPRCTIHIGRPRADSHISPHAVVAAHRQHCHSCERSFDSTTTSCTHCGHEPCALCPMLPDSSAESASAMVPLVERVYKKPRQRVRYNCENCNVQFTDRHECTGCGHERCENCPRYPPRKPKHTEDVAVWASVQAKLATMPIARTLDVPETTLSIMDSPQARL